jgi:hypothetical protein
MRFSLQCQCGNRVFFVSFELVPLPILLLANIGKILPLSHGDIRQGEREGEAAFIDV